ncbi:DgyrCDS1536 [Dimorphilus gyrociliatus]|uniref:DgyrCDS1536 n=1 Tax=Dimorphilus gyrociliatus TaxID=2664684 RepID=A0A7I8V7T6_9ANNE|nr:DgyrCDS1536 [Dimorphilus gyrociliatus]
MFLIQSKDFLYPRAFSSCLINKVYLFCPTEDEDEDERFITSVNRLLQSGGGPRHLYIRCKLITKSLNFRRDRLQELIIFAQDKTLACQLLTPILTELNERNLICDRLMNSTLDYNSKVVFRLRSVNRNNFISLIIASLIRHVKLGDCYLIVSKLNGKTRFTCYENSFEKKDRLEIKLVKYNNSKNVLISCRCDPFFPLINWTDDIIDLPSQSTQNPTVYTRIKRLTPLNGEDYLFNLIIASTCLLLVPLVVGINITKEVVKRRIAWLKRPRKEGLLDAIEAQLEQLSKETQSSITSQTTRDTSSDFASIIEEELLFFYRKKLWETNNPIYGPTNLLGFSNRNPGGSSGGEAVLLSGQGSILGVGSDIGGSLRIPSHMAGTCALKLTPNRIGSRKIKGVQVGQEVVKSCYGPMARDIDTIRYFLENVLVDEYFKMDPLAYPIPFNKEMYNSTRKLKIGYYDSLNYCKSFPVVRRSIKMAKEQLEKKGYELVPFELPDVEYALSLFIISLYGDNGKSIADATEHDELSSAIKISATLCQIAKPMKYIIGYIAKLIKPDLGRAVLDLLRIRSVSGWWKHTHEANMYRNKVWDKWNSLGLDAVLCPTFPCPAVELGKFSFAASASFYTGIYNLLSCPAGSLPMTKVTAEDEMESKKYQSVTTPEKVLKDQCTSGSIGLSCSVQIVTKPFQDELCLRIMKDLEVSSA